MTALSLHGLACRQVAKAIRPEALGPLLARIYRCVAGVAASHGARLHPVEDADLLLSWPGVAATRACRAALALMGRLEQLRPLLALRYGQELRPQLGVGTSAVRARLLQRAGLFYGAAALIDGVLADAARGIELREIDLISAPRGGLLWRSEAVQVTGIDFRALAAHGDPPAGIFELLGAAGEVPEQHLRRRDAFERALAHYRGGRMDSAHAILRHLAVTGGDDPATMAYLAGSRERLSETLPRGNGVSL